MEKNLINGIMNKILIMQTNTIYKILIKKDIFVILKYKVAIMMSLVYGKLFHNEWFKI